MIWIDLAVALLGSPPSRELHCGEAIPLVAMIALANELNNLIFW